MSSTVFKSGLRVVRGPDWMWGSQDTGEGNLGTVTGLRSSEVVVLWDTGKSNVYRAGNNHYDLRIFDTAPTGVTHSSVQCDACSECPLYGIRWKCAVCNNFDLCSQCYHKGSHDLSHPFYRIMDQSCEWVIVQARSMSAKKTLSGFFPGAVVTRGPDWCWNNQDGGQGKTGTLKSFYAWKGISARAYSRSGACIQWSASNTKNNYRIAFEGKVDIICKVTGNGGNYYPTHLALLNLDGLFNPGDKVAVISKLPELQRQQEGHGGYNDSMSELVGQIGKVKQVLDSGDVIVDFSQGILDPTNPFLALFGLLARDDWCFNPNCLRKVSEFAIDDKVTVIDDTELIKAMQKGHGGWVNAMALFTGKTGIVIKVDPNHIKVKFGVVEWTYSPAALKKEIDLTVEEGGNLGILADLLLSTVLENSIADKDEKPEQDTVDRNDIVPAAARGDIAIVQKIIGIDESSVHLKVNDKSALQLACLNGYQEIVELLLNFGANIEEMDNSGNTALHYAAMGGMCLIARFLIRREACVNVQNTTGHTPLHVAVMKGHVDFVQLMTCSHCDVNITDGNGETAFHAAISSDRMDIGSILVDAPNFDFHISNSSGLNAMHHCAMKGADRCLEKIVSDWPEGVNARIDDGSTCLHLAALSGHEQACKILLDSGSCAIDMSNSKGITALMLAAQNNFLALVRLLVIYGANVNAEDHDGHTALHLVVLGRAGIGCPSLTPEQITAKLGDARGSATVISAFLITHGAKLDYVSHSGRTPVDCCTNSQLKDNIETFYGFIGGVVRSEVDINTSKDPVANAPKSPKTPTELSCRLCTDVLPLADFLPCGHCVCCYQCSKNFRTCPVCKVTVSDIDPNLQKMTDCVVCGSEKAIVVFKPCGCLCVCYLCSRRARNCIKCRSQVLETSFLGMAPGRFKISKKHCVICLGHKTMNQTCSALAPVPKEDAVKHDETLQCTICLEKPLNVVFQCGHGACQECASTLQICHMCRRQILQRITTYF